MIPVKKKRKKEIKFYGHREYLQRVLCKWREVKWTTLFNCKMYKCYLLIKSNFIELTEANRVINGKFLIVELSSVLYTK